MSDAVPSDAADETPGGRSGLRSASGRVEAFSDGVLAIAITLLVLNLKVPDGTPGTVVQQLRDQWTAYVAYLASFIYVGVVWVSHHALFTRIDRVDSGVLWRNLVLLLAVSVLPFPTATLAFAMQHGTYSDQLASLVLYGLVAVGMACTWLIMFSYLDGRNDLLSDDVPVGFFREERRRAAFGIASPVLTIAIGIIAPAVALLAFLVLPLFYALTAEGVRPRGRTSRRTDGDTAPHS